MTLRLAALLCSLALCGCASVCSVAVNPSRNDIYGGVRLDGRLIGAAATNGSIQCGLQNCDAPRVWMLASGAVCDLPLSSGSQIMRPYRVSKL